MPPLASSRNAIWSLALIAATAVGQGRAPEAASISRRSPVVEAVAKVQPAVVSISSEKKAASPSRWPFSAEENQRPRVSGMGTGVILDGRGYILTNQHVVDKVQGILVHLFDGSTYQARVVQQDEATDLAILKIDAGRSLTPISLGRSDDLMVGEEVITIGNAYGYENTVSVGIVSALNRNVTLSDEQVYRNLIQTDACINPGNSGGPLVNIEGELIGINVAVRAGAQGIGFALPIDDVKRVAVEMMSTRRLVGLWHGIQAVETRTTAGTRQVVVADVQSGSPAESGGIKIGDELVQVGELKVASPLDLERGLLEQRPGQTTSLVVKRAGQEQTVPIELRPQPRQVADASEQVWRILGLKISPIGKEYVTTASPNLKGGLYVQNVAPNGPAAKAMIQRGDILVGMQVGSKLLETVRPDNVLYVLRQPEISRSGMLPFYIVRRSGIHEGVFNLAEVQQTTRR